MEFRDERRYDFDAMRGTMMLLGIVFHACVSFTISDTGDLWPYQFEQPHLIFDAVVGALHVFRIPAFFMISGFFLTRQLSRHSLKKVIQKRLQRVALPFVACFLLIAPIVTYGFFLLYTHLKAFSKVSFQYYFQEWEWNTVHFWFLYYLIIFHVFQFLLRKTPFVGQYFKSLPLYISFLVMILVQISILVLFGNESANGDYSLLPGTNSLIYFGAFYFFGNQVYYHLDTFEKWIQRSSLLYIAAIIFPTIYLLIRQQTYIGGVGGQLLIVESFATVLASNALILATFAFFRTIFSDNSKRMQYLSKASYLIYIVHLPILIWTLWLIRYWVSNPFILVFLLISITSTISLGIYQVQQKYWKSLL